MNPTVEEFRDEARAWLEAHLDRRTGGERTTRGLTHRTVEDIAEQRAIQRRVHAAGFAGISWPVAFGGRGLTSEHEAAFNDEAAAFVLPDLGIAGIVTMAVCANVMLRHASAEFNQRHLPRILSGDEVWVEFFSDPSAGSDLAGVTTTAVRDGDAWILNGSKVWSSGAYYADYGLCLARTDWDQPKHKGLTWFAVSTTQPGVTVEPLREITGDIEFCREDFHDVVIPDAERIGDVGDGWQVAQTALRFEREASSGGLTAVETFGVPGPLAPDLVELARRAGSQRDAHVRQLIAQAHTDDFALRALGVRLARLMSAGHPAGPGLISYSKLGAGVIEPKRAKTAMEIGAEAAIAWPESDQTGVTFALDYLNSRVKSIAGGTNEIQRNALGERVLGLPREPSFDRGKTFREVHDAALNWSGES
jgi:alkylation response protein AidB-like acyl-CoA dehydrogenase